MIKAVTALSRLITDRMKELDLTVREVADRSADAPSGPIVHGTVVAYRKGKHPVSPNLRVLRSLSWALDIPLLTLERAAGVRESRGAWVPPPEADQMTVEQRDLISTLIKMLVAYPEPRPDPDPEPDRTSSPRATERQDTDEVVVAISEAVTGAAEKQRREEWERSQQQARAEEPQTNGHDQPGEVV